MTATKSAYALVAVKLGGRYGAVSLKRGFFGINMEK